MPIDALLAAIPTPCINGSKRARADGEERSTTAGKGKDVEKAITMLDAKLRVVESFTEEVFLIPAAQALSVTLLQAVSKWNNRKPETGPHPDGAPRHTVAAALLTFIAQSVQPSCPFAEQASSLQSECSSVNKFDDLEEHVVMCMARSTKKGDQVLLKFTWARYSALNQSIQLQVHVLLALGAIHQSGPAPRGQLIRQLA